MARAGEIAAPLDVGPAGAGGPRLALATFGIENMSCGGCMRAVEAAVRSLEGVEMARANLSARRLTVRFDPARLDGERIVEALAGAGYRAGELADAAEGEAPARALLRRLAVAGFAAANIMLLSVAVWAGAVSDMDGATSALFHWLSALIALPTVVYSGQPFFRSARDALAGWRLNMDVPISVAILLATASSLFQTIEGGHEIYFDAAVTLLFFLLIGRYLDQRMRLKAQGAAENLIGLMSMRATVIGHDGSPTRLPSSDVRAGDRVLVAAGERIPVDGRVARGESQVDEALITGESAPSARGCGDEVYAGTINLTGPLWLTATAAHTSTLLAELGRLMDAAEQARGRYVRLADRAAQIYAPAVHILGLATFIGWMIAGAGWEMALTTAIAVLIITCPCALALAVPSVQVAAAARLFGRGIILKSGDGLERLAEIDRVIFDKTGTLTLGRPQLLDDALDNRTLAEAAGLAANSRHPYSQALVAAAEARGLDVRPRDHVTELPGAGLSLEIDGREARLGSAMHCGADPDERTDASLYFKSPDGALTAFRFRDPLRDDATDVVRALTSAGLPVEILSGDRTEPVADTARALGITDFAATQTPDQKIALLERLRGAGHKPLMVGDGLNDAPSLAAAQASLSPSTAADISQQTADAVFQGDRLAPLLECLAVARAAKRMSLQNFGLAAAYNMVCIPLAAMGLVTPLIAAIAMSTSSLLVTANALRLRTARLELAK